MELCINLPRGNERGSTDSWLEVKVEDWGERHLQIGGSGEGGS